MARPKNAPPIEKSEDRMPWPSSPKELRERPRVFRVERLDSFAWQAYVIEDNKESPIGKPDLFDILINKIKGVMRAEGQRKYLAERAEAAKVSQPEEAAHE